MNARQKTAAEFDAVMAELDTLATSGDTPKSDRQSKGKTPSDAEETRYEEDEEMGRDEHKAEDEEQEAAEAEALREWAEVPSGPDDGDSRKARPCVRRDLALRVRQRQGERFADGSPVNQFAMVTNREGDGFTLRPAHPVMADGGRPAGSLRLGSE